MTTVAIHQPQYLPWVPYCDKADACDIFVYLDTVQYQKNGLQNRNKIKTAQGGAWLTVPVHVKLGDLIKDVKTSDSHWVKKHIASIEQNYSRAAHAELFGQGLRPLLEHGPDNLADLNIQITEWFFSQLGVGCRRVRASELNITGNAQELVIDICKALGATRYLSGKGASDYQDNECFAREGIELVYQDYTNQPYRQCHSGIGFVPDLSALDLILNEGPNARSIMMTGRNKK